MLKYFLNILEIKVAASDQSSTELTSTPVIDTVGYCRVCLDKAHPQLQIYQQPREAYSHLVSKFPHPNCERLIMHLTEDAQYAVVVSVHFMRFWSGPLPTFPIKAWNASTAQPPKVVVEHPKMES